MSVNQPSHTGTLQRVTNFGGNVSFRATVLRPRTHDDVVEALNRVSDGRRIRALGNLKSHAWSEISVGDVVLDCRALASAHLLSDANGRVLVEVEVGCRLDFLLKYLESHGYTLPVFPATGKVTMGGAIATGPHGSGRSSLSHYVTQATVARYGPGGRAYICSVEGGDELRAVRCGIGAAGIVLSVQIPVEPAHLLEEHTEWFDGLPQILAKSREFPRLQFYLVPWSWQWFAQLRRRLSPYVDQKTTVLAPIRRTGRLLLMDVVFNGAIRLFAGYIRSPRIVRWLWRRVFPLLTKAGGRLVDRPRHIALMRRELYRHIEMELFVPEQHVEHAAGFVQWVLCRCAADAAPLAKGRWGLPCDVMDAVERALVALFQEPYVHDYVLTFRRVLPDDTLLSMASGRSAKAWYAISLVSYQQNRDGFLAVATVIATVLARAFGARPHWGKVYPITAEITDSLYPNLAAFREVCRQFDPYGRLTNDFTRRILSGHEQPHGGQA